MKLVRWKRYLWDLKKLPTFESPLGAAYVVRQATQEEQKSVMNVIFTAFSLDTAWGDSFKAVRGFIEAQVAQSFVERSPSCLVVTHGTRIIGASAMNITDNAVSNLVSGPCVLTEYGSRGLGTALLYASLKWMRDNGLEHAVGISKDGVPASKFIYSKFESRSEEMDDEQLLAS